MNLRSLILTFAIVTAASTGLFAQSAALPTPTPDPTPTPAIDRVIPGDQADIATRDQGDMGYTRPDGKTRAKKYFKSMFGPISLARSAATAGISTARNSPEEWGPGWEGFGRRFASNMGKSVIKNSTMYGLDEALKVDSTFYKSKKRDAGSRIKNALISPFTARNERGKRVLGVPRLVGTYTSNVVAAETWFPQRYDYKDGLRSGTISLGFNAAFNLFREFVWK